MQQFGRLDIPVTGELVVDSEAQKRDLREFYDAQIQVAELFGSPAEFRFWLMRWFRQLVEEGKH